MAFLYNPLIILILISYSNELWSFGGTACKMCNVATSVTIIIIILLYIIFYITH